MTASGILRRPGPQVQLRPLNAGLPHAVAALAARSHGREIVLSITHPAWVDTTGFLVQAERTHVRACVDSAYWTFMMTSQFICTSSARRSRRRMAFRSASTPRKRPRRRR